MNAPNHLAGPSNDWKTELAADLERVAVRDRWGLALMIMGWVHLAVFATCQSIYIVDDHNHFHYLGLWILEFIANFFVMRKVTGRGWIRKTPLAGVIARIWATFLILSFNVATLNRLTGFQIEWHKPAWATLSTFGFATTAYLTSLWYFVPAVQMYFTGLLMIVFPRYQFIIFGFSWWVAFQGIGMTLERKRAQREAMQLEPKPQDATPIDAVLAERA